MKKLLLTAALLSTCQLAFAHEGHDTGFGSLFHYFSAPHLLGTIAVGVVLSSALYYAVQRRNRR